MHRTAIEACPRTTTTRSVSVALASDRYYSNELVPEVTWPDPQDPRRTGPGFEVDDQIWLLERIQGQRDDQSRASRVALFRLGRDEELPDGKGAQRKNLTPTRENVAAYPYISLLESSYQAVIRVDVDEAERIEDLKDLAIPPNAIGFNAGPDPSHRGRFQAWWVLDIPVSMANPKATALLSSVQSMLKLATGADKSGTGDVNRCPWFDQGEYSWHLLHRRTWKLHELQDRLTTYLADAMHLDDLLNEGDQVGQHGDDGARVTGVYTGPRILNAAQREKQRQGRHVGEGRFRPWRVDLDGRLLRNCSAFLMVSEVARKTRVREGRVDRADLMEVLHEINELIEEDWPGRDGLPASELRDIARKVDKYWNKRFDPRYQGGCAFYTEEGRRLGSEALRRKGDETRRQVARWARLSCNTKEIAERVGIVQRRVQQILSEFRRAATQGGVSFRSFLDGMARRKSESNISSETRNRDFVLLWDDPSEVLPDPSDSSSELSSSSASSIEDTPKRRKRRRRRRARL